MIIHIVAFTHRGIALAERLALSLGKAGNEVSAFSTKKETPSLVVRTMEVPLRSWTEEAMAQADGIVFIGACGIAVRSVAPFLRGKDQDPAVVVIDENAHFAIALLSGHVGGANDLARQIGELTGATAVVTTATDSGGRFPVDDWAVKQNLWIDNLKAAKAVSMAVLEGEWVGFCSQVPWEGPLPDGVQEAAEGPVGICVSYDRRQKPFHHTLNLIPKSVVLGIGCRKGISVEAIRGQVERALDEEGIPWGAVSAVASLDLKGEEPGLLAFCEERGLPFTTYSAQELSAVEGSVSSSAFVRSTTGVDNVCERSAIRKSGGRLLFPKRAGEGVTVAAACGPVVLQF